MRRFGRSVIFVGMLMVCGTGAAQAQTPEGKWSIMADVAGTFGHVTDSSVGGELTYAWKSNIDIIVEGGHLRNITTTALETRAGLVAAAIGGTAKPVQSALYYDAGVRLYLMPSGSWNPYVTVGGGATRVNTQTTITVVLNGAVVPNVEGVYGLQFGSDLDGYVTKPFAMVGAGVNVPFGRRYTFDLSYRFGRIFPAGSIDGDSGVSTQRAQLGVGLRF
jgi:opacity protein-like surface antigen